jgi:hypothetical protein
VWRFCLKYSWEIVTKHIRLAKQWIALDLMRRRLRNE